MTKIIRSNNPNDIKRLQQKLKFLIQQNKMMKYINENYKKHGMKFIEEMDASPKVIEGVKVNLAKPNFKNIPFPNFYFKDNNAEIKRLKERISQLQKEKK